MSHPGCGREIAPMDHCSAVNTGYNVHGPIDIWQNHFIGALPQPQILNPELGALFSTPTHSNTPALDYSTNTLTPEYSPSYSGMSTPSDSSNVPSPTDSVPSPFFVTFTPDSLALKPAKKPSHSKKRPPGHIPRPRNAFILFRGSHGAAIPKKVENDNRHISKIMGELWNKVSPAERLIWEQKADIEKERHSRMYPNYRYRPTKPNGIVKRRVTCRSASALSAYSSSPGIGKSNGACEMVGSLNADQKGELRFGNTQRARLIDQEERRKDKTRCARVAELVRQGIVGEKLEAEAQRLGLDRDSIASPTPQLQPSIHDPPGKRSQFHTNVDILRALQGNDDTLAFTDPFASNNASIPPQENMLPINSELPATAPALPETEDALCARRHALTPLATPPLASPASNDQLLPLFLPVQQPGTTSGPTRSSSSSPLGRQRRLHHPYPRRGWGGERHANGDLDSDPDLSFNHVSYHSSGNSPTEQYLSPHARSRPQLGSTTHPSSPAATPPLYGVESAYSGRPHEPIDLSAIYNQGDTATSHEAASHSTYAIDAGNTYSPNPAPPALLSDIPISQQLALTCGPVSNNTTGPDPNAEPGPSSGYYGWQSPFGSEPGYSREIEYEEPTSVTSYGAIPPMYYPDETGAPSY
ncbi:similar to S69204 pheromone response factor 1-smut fungus (Ustilago maydis) [Rhizoctonia solani]|uniref:Similar to S69204 pheromone response factor 1-smut fungus (Ustilago maydis) n=1 Tax=Rhizoctonia solani TaxID=456999 RepID=A0A0K6G768_9AGAM|nr:similar to S69204 pheromone response factor 1-smut fungus (Ustilago maydis) [Rhizoctonia solani]